jgi:hypothetical protein
MKIYRMIIENTRTGARSTYTSQRAGASPAGWICISVCGYFIK